MSDLITPTAYSDKSTQYETARTTLEGFRELTMNRNKNLGSLVANGKGGLKCVDHHVFRPLNGFGSVKPEDAKMVRQAFVNAVIQELNPRFDILINSEQARNPGNVDLLNRKIKELKQSIVNMFLDKENGDPRSSAFAPLRREDVKDFIVNIELLEKNATSERLLKMNAAQLLNLSDRGNRQEAEKYESQSWVQLRDIIAQSKSPEVKARTNAKNAYDNAVKAMKAANLEDLKKFGQGFLCATFPKIWEGDDPEKFKAFNAAFADKGAMFVYLDEKGELTFYDRANETEIRSHYEQLIEAVAYMEEAVANKEFEQVAPEELGGVPTKETIAKTLNDFADKLNTAKSEAEKAVAAAQEEAQKKELSEKLGESLGNVTDRETLRKATNDLLHKCDSMLVNLSEFRRRVGNVNVKMAEKNCKSKFERAFHEGGIDSFHMNDTCELELEEGTSIDTIKKDVGRLLAAIIDRNIVINGSDSGKQDRLREFLCCSQNDKKALPPAVQDFVAELSGSRHDDHHPILDNENKVDEGGLGVEPPVEEKNTSSVKTEVPQEKSVLEQIEEELEKKEKAKKSAAQIPPEGSKTPEKAPATCGHKVMSRDAIMAMEDKMTFSVKGKKYKMSPKEAQKYIDKLEVDVEKALQKCKGKGFDKRTGAVWQIMGNWLKDPKFIAAGLVLAKAKGYKVRTQKDIAANIGMKMDGNGLFMVGKPKLKLFAPKYEVVHGSGQDCAEKIAAEHQGEDDTISYQVFADATKIGGGTMGRSFISQEETTWRDSLMAFFGEMLENCEVKDDGTYVAPHINKGTDGMPIFNSAAGYTADGELKSNALLPLKGGEPIKIQYCFTASPARCDDAYSTSTDVDNVATFAMRYQKLVSRNINEDTAIPQKEVEGAKKIVEALNDLLMKNSFAPNRNENGTKKVKNLYQKAIDMVITDGLVIDGEKIKIFKKRSKKEADQIALKLANAFVSGKIGKAEIDRAQMGVAQAIRLADRDWVLMSGAKYNIKGLGGMGAFGCTKEMVIPNQMDNWALFSGGRTLVYSDYHGKMKEFIDQNMQRADKEIVKIAQGYGYSNDEIMEGFREGRRTNAEIRERFLAAGVAQDEVERLIQAYSAVGYDAGE